MPCCILCIAIHTINEIKIHKCLQHLRKTKNNAANPWRHLFNVITYEPLKIFIIFLISINTVTPSQHVFKGHHTFSHCSQPKSFLHF